jgi:glycosyltransferase involved in cell wall biosynthesis
MSSQQPTVSVIIPVYNVEAFIADTLDSVLRQTFQDFEVIVVDDESPDGSVELVKQFQDPRIRLIHQKNRGLAGARNAGIRVAKGQFLAFLDSDDMWRPEKLEKHIQHLKASPDVGVSYSRSEFMDEQSRPLGTYIMSRLRNITAQELLLTNPVGNGSAPVIRREVLDEIAYPPVVHGQRELWYFDETFRRAEDIECWARIALQTRWKFEGLPEPLTWYRVNTRSLSGNFGQQHEAMLAVLQKISQYAPDFAARHESLIKACNARYLSRSALRMKNADAAVEFIHRALAYDWRILVQNFRSTMFILLSAYLFSACPSGLRQGFEKALHALTQVAHRRALKQSVPKLMNPLG